MQTKMKYPTWFAFIAPPFVCMVTLFFYFPSLSCNFIFDDLPRISKNFHLKFYSLSKLFFADTRWLSKVLNHFTYMFYKLNPFGYRIINLIMHLVIGFLIFTLLYLVLQRCKNLYLQSHAFGISFFTSSLFLLHPAQTQTVTYITQMRLEGLVVLFTFAILLFFSLATFTHHKRKKIVFYSSALLLTCLASGTKEIIVGFPVLQRLVDWFFLAQGSYKIIIKRLLLHGCFALTLFGSYSYYRQPLIIKDALTFNIAVDNNRGNKITEHSDEKIKPYQFFISQFKVIVHYIKIFFWPFNLSFDYDITLASSFWSRDVLLPFLGLLLLVLFAFFLFLQNPTHIFSFAVAWFFISILPRASIIPSPELVCDYKTYLPSFGIFILLAIALYWMMEKAAYALITIMKQHRSYAQIGVYALACLMFLGLGFASKQRNTVWRSRLDFWKDVTSKAPNKARAFNNLAVGFAEIGDTQRAIDTYKKSLACDPTYAEPHMNLAFHYQALKNRKEALKHYKIALNLAKAAHPELYFNLGVFNFEAKDYEKSIRSLRIATRLRPYYSKAHYRLGMIHQIQNNLPQAFESYQKAIEGNLQTTELYYRHGNIGSQIGKYQQAIESFNKVISLDENYKKANFMLGSCYYHMGNFQQAARYFAHSYKREPHNNAYAYNYAQALLKSRMQRKEKRSGARITPLHRNNITRKT
jgi:tetratricopeptide (TPR) repeat protein